MLGSIYLNLIFSNLSNFNAVDNNIFCWLIHRTDCNCDLSNWPRKNASQDKGQKPKQEVFDGVDAHGSSGLVVYTHEWWMQSGPEVDPYAADQGQLAASRKKILDLNPVKIIPAHGPAYVPLA